MNGTAHLTTLDGSDVIRANDVYGIQPLLVEKTGEDVSEGEYYAVAVVHKVCVRFVSALTCLEGILYADDDTCRFGRKAVVSYGFSKIGTLFSMAKWTRLLL